MIILLLLCLSAVQANDNSTENTFTKIYQEGEWGKDENGNGTSGSGATIEEAKPYFDFLVEFIRKKNITSVVDVGCGDWQFSQFIDWSGIDYTGYDVVKSVIESNNQRFSASNVKFIHGNALLENLPPADLLICKDVLQHLSIKMIKTFLKQTKKFKYCLITNDIDPLSPSQNVKSDVGCCRPIDLTKKPFKKKGTNVLDYQSGITHKQVFLITK